MRFIYLFGFVLLISGLVLGFQNCAKQEGAAESDSTGTVINTPDYEAIGPAAFGSKFIKMTTSPDARPAWCAATQRWCRFDIQGTILKKRAPYANMQVSVCYHNSNQPNFVAGGCVAAQTDGDGNLQTLDGGQISGSTCFDISTGLAAIFKGNVKLNAAGEAVPGDTVLTQTPIVGANGSYTVQNCPL